jgi:predicted AlkP superfamily phosphohydrolase/phosphomutase
MARGAYGRLRSSEPPITVPAWACMLSGKDPGELGIYGFRNRADHSYERMTIATGASLRVDRIWDILARAGKQSIVLSVPPTYPVKPANGQLVSCFLTPPKAEQYTWPRELRAELETHLGEPYIHDVMGFRTDDKGWLLNEIYRMTKQHFAAVHYMLEHKPWDFFMFVEIGVDRIHHGFWSNMDPTHPHYVAGNPFENAIHDYYVYIDGEIGRVLEELDQDTVVLVLSDHGARAMQGGFCINEWLRREGLLTLKEEPSGPVPLEKCEVDWTRTKVWGSGGYYARVFFNVEGREPQGVIPASQYDAFRNEMVRRFEATTGPDGQLLGTVARIPGQIYRRTLNVPPDLIVYFGNLAWRSVGSLGLGSLHTFENDTGPDDANHDWNGIFVAFDPRIDLGGRELTGLQLQSVAPTILGLMGAAVPEDIEAGPITIH